MNFNLNIESDVNDKKNNVIRIEMMHIVNGEWVHIVQYYEDKETEYFTDGAKEKPIENECTLA